jgi:hypothetical protein
VLEDDPPTCAVFDEILRNEVFHMNYALTQLAARAAWLDSSLAGAQRFTREAIVK